MAHWPDGGMRRTPSFSNMARSSMRAEDLPLRRGRGDLQCLR
jgi:hypothetical protein